MISLAALMFTISVACFITGCATGNHDHGSRLINAAAIFALAGCVCLK